MNNTHSSNYFKTFNQRERIYFQKYDCGNQSLKQIIAVHDAGLYHCQYDFLIKDLKGENISFFTIDLKGHGLSSGSRNQIDNFDDCALDLVTFININLVIKSDEPLYLMGSGVGGTIILNLLYFYSHLLKKEVSGLILVNPQFGCRNFQAKEAKLLSKLIKNKRNFKLPFPQTGYDLTDDLAIAEKYNSDPLIDFSFPLNFISQMNLVSQKIINYSYFLDCPLLLLTNQDGYQKFKISIRPDLLTYKTYSGNKRDILNDYERKKCFNDIRDWLGSREDA